MPVRADIVDRHGVPLARTMDAWSIAVKPAEVLGDRVELAESLHEIFPDQSAASFHRLLTAKKKFVYLRPAMTAATLRDGLRFMEPALLDRYVGGLEQAGLA